MKRRLKNLPLFLLPAAVLWAVFFAALCAAFFAASCTTISPASPAKAGRPAEPGFTTETENKLETPAFKAFPPEAGDYLKTLAEAFRKKDRAFLLSQGETSYEAELRPRYDEESYLAMLYRAGAYAEDDPWSAPALPLLNCEDVAGIEYTAWFEESPMLRIQGRLHLLNGDPIPCEIMLIWRLKEPKIVGIYP
jgi:hypothetical protein